MAGISDAPFVQTVAVPSVCLLIAFLGYFSQLVFHRCDLEPGPPTRAETITFNTLLLILWYTYYKAVTVDSGRYVFPRVMSADADDAIGRRWCRKCNAPKPPRAHHCRSCRRCVPKMDHHCPWTGNCVSMTTFPHFLRFLVWTNITLWTLGSLVWQRFRALWAERLLPAYLGPSLPALIALSIVALVCFFTSLALGIMLATTVKTWLFNRTMIEGWEQDRHEVIVDRAGRDFWDMTGPDGEKIRFERTEFPYDIGFYANMSQAMGSRNPLLWFFPFAGGPKVGPNGQGVGWEWEENGFNHSEGMWPPPDPDKIRSASRAWPAAKRDYAEELRELDLSPDEQKAAFRQRQEHDIRRRNKLMAELEEVDDYEIIDDEEHYDDDDAGREIGYDGTPGWMNSDGERLRDYGVDEDDDDDDMAEDDDVPLAEIIRRRKVLSKDEED